MVLATNAFSHIKYSVRVEGQESLEIFFFTEMDEDLQITTENEKADIYLGSGSNACTCVISFPLCFYVDI